MIFEPSVSCVAECSKCISQKVHLFVIKSSSCPHSHWSPYYYCCGCCRCCCYCYYRQYFCCNNSTTTRRSRGLPTAFGHLEWWLQDFGFRVQGLGINTVFSTLSPASFRISSMNLLTNIIQIITMPRSNQGSTNTSSVHHDE